jgi:predicted CopG family antitoxin
MVPSSFRNSTETMLLPALKMKRLIKAVLSEVIRVLMERRRERLSPQRNAFGVFD